MDALPWDEEIWLCVCVRESYHMSACVYVSRELTVHIIAYHSLSSAPQLNPIRPLITTAILSHLASRALCSTHTRTHVCVCVERQDCITTWRFVKCPNGETN